MTTKEAYLEKIETQLRSWREQIDQLESSVMSAQAQAGLKYREQVDELAKRQAQVEQKLQALKRASGDQWESLKIEVDQALAALAESFDQVQETQRSWLGWAQGMTEKRKFDSEGWVEGMGHRTGHSEGWAEGVGHPIKDSHGWAEGMKTR